MENNTFVGLKKLEAFSCEVQKLNDEESDDTQCILNFKVGNNSQTEDLKLAISKPGLDVLLDGLHKIQNQLFNVANKIKS